jgi:hypothetical protein
MKRIQELRKIEARLHQSNLLSTTVVQKMMMSKANPYLRIKDIDDI